MAEVDAVVFDVGGVLLDWDPRHLLRKLLPDREMEHFLAEVCPAEWNARQDAGRSWDDAVEDVARRHPEQAELVRIYRARWLETLAGAYDDTVAVLADVRAGGVPTYALTNYSAEKWRDTVAAFPFLSGFDGVVVSGEEGVTKPDPRIYRVLLERFDLRAGRTFFTDDLPANVAGARALGIRADVFVNAESLRDRLRELGVLRTATSGAERRS